MKNLTNSSFPAMQSINGYTTYAVVCSLCYLYFLFQCGCGEESLRMRLTPGRLFQIKMDVVHSIFHSIPYSIALI